MVCKLGNYLKYSPAFPALTDSAGRFKNTEVIIIVSVVVTIIIVIIIIVKRSEVLREVRIALRFAGRCLFTSVFFFFLIAILS